MSIVQRAFSGAIWLGTFKVASQTFSWIATIIIARILLPEDYGIMEMATILTGYVALFSELGLGAAIIQRETINEEELSSLFWFLVFWGVTLAVGCMLLAYPTVAIFSERRLLSVTQSVSVLFIIGSFIIIPKNILNRELRFKTIGIIETISVTISCVVMIVIAKSGGGVWTLIGGHIIREVLRCILFYCISSWRPQLHFNLKEIRPYLKFGINVAGTSSLHYIIAKSDRFFCGKILGTGNLGYYSLALQLASVPNDKLIYLIKTVSFPIFSRYQKSYEEFNRFYLKITNLIAFIVFPVYIGGIFLSDELIPLVLGSKWTPMIFPFKLLCITQLINSMGTLVGISNTAQGRPHWNFYMALISVIVLPFGFFVSSKYGLNSLPIPWITVYPLLTFVFLYITLRKIRISFNQYLRVLKHPLFATISMLLVLSFLKYFYFSSLNTFVEDIKTYVIIILFAGMISYSFYVIAFQRSFLNLILNLRRE
jgi:O-antigen/teichoic acid export membrane protein